MQSHHITAFLVGSVEGFVLPEPARTDTELVDLFWPQIGVVEVRELTAAAFLRPETAAHKTMIVRSNFITHEAQNALLKLLEEPPQATAFVLVQPLDFQYLDTISSRLGSVTVEAAKSSDDWNDFLASSYADRLTLIETRLKAKDTAWILAQKHGLVHWLSSEGRTLPAAALTRLNLIVTKLLTRGAGNKMLLEELALTLPVRKR